MQRARHAWLEEMFEYEYCSECGGDEADHTAILLDLGPYGANYFARCDRVPA